MNIDTIALSQRAAQRGGFFTRADAHLFGFDDAAILRMVRSGHWTNLRKGHYADSALLDRLDPISRHEVDVRVALARVSDAYVSHESAAYLHGANLLFTPSKVVLSSQPGCHTPYKDLVVHAAALPADHLAEIRPSVVGTTPPRTVIDIARTRTFVAALVVADSMLRLGLVSMTQMLGICDDCAGWPGVRRATRVVEAGNPLAETPLESLSRGRMIELDIELPELQVWIETDIGSCRVDYYWRRLRLIGESDGRVKYANPSALWDEKRRHDALLRTDHRIVRWTYDEVLRTPLVFDQRIRTAMRAAERLAS